MACVWPGSLHDVFIHALSLCKHALHEASQKHKPGIARLVFLHHPAYG
jgi:hypothetical protein